MKSQTRFFKFFLKFILPTLLVLIIYILLIFSFLLPEYEKAIISRKREMIKELTNSACSIFSYYHEQEKNGTLTKTEAQKKSIETVESLRYGNEFKDYFWITDTHPIMIMHPYRSDLDSTDLTNFADPTGKRLFVEFVKTVSKDKQYGYVDYMWQWKDDSSKIVPKLSYVKLFKPWNWVIGTGIYIEDVKAEISGMENKLIKISVLIFVVVFIILLIITLQSYKIEKQRRTAESELEKSHQKYKTVVEDLNDGILLVVNGLIVYSNKIVQDLLGYNNYTLNNRYILDILSDEDKNGQDGIRYFKDINQTSEPELNYEVRLKTQKSDLIKVDLTVRKTEASEYNGYILKIKPLSDRRKKLSEEFYKFNRLTDNINIGVFRAQITKRGKFLEANQATLKILGFETKKELFKTEIFSFFHDKNDRNEFIKTLFSQGVIKNSVVRLNRSDGKIISISISASLIHDDSGNPCYCDGIIEDISEKLKREELKEELITELQTSLMFYNQPVKHFIKPLLSCTTKQTIQDVAIQMIENKSSAILVVDENKNQLGIITNHDFKERAISQALGTDQPAYLIMTSPIVAISDNSLLFEALNIMIEKDISTIAVKKHDGLIVSLLSFKELSNVQQYSSAYHFKRLEHAKNVSEIIKLQSKVPEIIRSLVETGSDSITITRLITNISDIITNKIIGYSIKELGEPPVKFAFIVLGSQGRNELTLATDQDNAIIYEDVDSIRAEELKEYFLQLGNYISDRLDESGYSYCKGKMMASNPMWNMPLSEWKDKFNTWVQHTEPQDILEINTFYDLRLIHGDEELFMSLKNYVTNSLDKKDIFLYNLASYALKFRPPVNIFGNIIKTVIKDKEFFNVKESQIAFTIYIRYLSLKNGISETNSIKRLKSLYSRNIISKDEYKSLSQAYDYLLLTRIKNHIYQINNNTTPDNHIDTKSLTDIELSMLKKIFSDISLFQEKLRLNFSGLI